VRARSGILASLLGAALWLAPAAFGASGTLTRAGGVAFPNRQYVMSVDSATSIDAKRVQVLENGHRVASLSVLPASAASARALGVVLVIDTSGSMRGAPIAGAMAAARAFASHRNSQQQLGVVTFNGTPTVLLQPTADPNAIQSALSTAPKLGRNTHIYDAVGTAIDLLGQAHIAGGSVVVLSDGSDTGSSLSVSALGARAKRAGVRIYSVGLRSGAFDPTALRSVASAGQGRYSEATSQTALGKIYDQLGVQLSSQYLIRYRSLARPHQRVQVTVSGPGVPPGATSSYVTPSLPSAPTPPFRRSVWQAATTQVGIALLIAFFLGLSLLVVLRANPPRRNLRARMADFVTPRSDRADGEARPSLASRLVASTERSLERKRWWAAFKEDVDVARIRMPAAQILLLASVATLIVMGLLYAFTQNAAVSLLGLACLLFVRSTISQRAGAQRKLFAEQLAENLQVIASAMRAGQSFSGALAVAVQDAPEPARSEFERVVADERLGVPLDVALGVVARRMKDRDLDQVQLVAALQRQTGGNMAEVLDQAADTIRERSDLRRLIRTLTAQGRMSRWVLTGLPVFLVLAISVLNPGYLSPLFHGGGRVVLVMAAALVVTGSYVIKRIIEIEV
jgi:tight adherence protein B